MNTREQRYATQAYTDVRALRPLDEKGIPTRLSVQQRAWCDQYGSMAHKLPVLIRTAGLAQALAFIAARGNDAHKQLANHLAVVAGYADHEVLAHNSRTASLREYMRLTHRVLAALAWYKRYAQSILDVQDANAAETPGGGENAVTAE